MRGKSKTRRGTANEMNDKDRPPELRLPSSSLFNSHRLSADHSETSPSEQQSKADDGDVDMTARSTACPRQDVAPFSPFISN